MSIYVGLRHFAKLIQISNKTGLPTGVVIDNDPENPNYIPDAFDPGICPNYSTEWRGEDESAVCEVEDLYPLDPKWVPILEQGYCEQNNGTNTGYLIQPKLKKVSNDLFEYPLDINNQRTTITGLPQSTMVNPPDSPTYRVLSNSCIVTLTFYNTQKQGTAVKNNCGSGQTGSIVTYTVPANTYSSTISQADADAKAIADVNLNKQSYANTNGTCNTNPTVGNRLISKGFVRNNCGSGQMGTSVIYTVPANKYFATTQVAADQQAQNEIDSLGQSYANQNGFCEIGQFVTLEVVIENEYENMLYSTSNSSGYNLIFKNPASSLYSLKFTNNVVRNNIVYTHQIPLNAIRNFTIIQCNLTVGNTSTIDKLVREEFYYNGELYGIQEHKWGIKTPNTELQLTFVPARAIVDLAGGDVIRIKHTSLDRGLFFNSSRSVTATRNNCNPDEIGTNVTLTVPEGTITSIISQADADQQAQNYLDSYKQTYANNVGTCIVGFKNTLKTATVTRNNCNSGGVGSSVTMTVPVGMFTSTISQADADQKATDYLNANKQSYANTNGTCTYTYYNIEYSATVTKNNCGVGQTGTSVTLTVPANTYSSTISQADANQKALDYLNANKQSYANTNGTCSSNIIYYIAIPKDGYTTYTSSSGSCSINFEPTEYAIYTTNANGILTIGSILYIYVNGAYQAYSGLGTFFSYFENSVRVWIQVNSGGVVVDKNNCDTFYTLITDTWGPLCESNLVVQERLFTINGTYTFQIGDRVFKLNTLTDTYEPFLGVPNISYIENNSRIVLSINSTGYITAKSICSTIYKSIEKSAITYRNNCSGGLQGSQVTYTVPAGRYESIVSQEDADQQAQADLDLNKQTYANQNGTCNTNLFTNDESIREYQRDNCGVGIPGNLYQYIIPANKYFGTTQQEVDSQVEADFAANGQIAANSYGTCPTDAEPITIWEVTGDPCTSPRVSRVVYYSKLQSIFYTSSGLITTLNSTFFLEDNNLGNYYTVINGVMQDSINNSCNYTGVLTYELLGNPADISIYGNNLLAAYPDRGVIVKYDISTSTNPVGTVVAGQLGKTSLGPQSPINWLNTPMLVEWRDDGERFVVYSGGFYKSLKIFNSVGNFLYEGASMDSYDEEWAYDTPSDTVNGKYETPTSNTSLVGMLTPTDTDLSNFWVPTSIEYSKKLNTDGFDVIFMALWHKNSDNHNHFKLYAIVPMPLVYFHGQSLTGNTVNSTGYADNGDDLIRGMQVINKRNIHTITPNTTRYTIAIVSPRSWTKSGNDKYRYYEVQELIVDIRAVPSSIFPELSLPLISPQSLSSPTSYRINSSTSGVWKNNVKAEVNFNNGHLIVVIKSTSDSLWNILLRTAAVPTAGLVVGYMLSLVGFSTATFGWWIGPLTAATVITPIGIVIAVLLLAAIVLFAPPRQRYVGSSALKINFNGDSSTREYYAGSYLMTTWIDNDIKRARAVYTNINPIGGLLLYSLSQGRVIKVGDWAANNNTSIITL